MIAQSSGAEVAGNQHDAEYNAFLKRIKARFTANTNKASLFTTDAEGVCDAYLKSFPVEQRQYHNCHTCRQFIERFGKLVTINNAGTIASAIWNEKDAPEFYKPAIRAIEELVRNACVNGVFLSAAPIWGNPVTGVWRHFAVTPKKETIYRGHILTAGQAMAEKREDYRTLQRALTEFSPAVIGQALTLLKTESLYRSEKVSGPVQWLHTLHVALKGTKGKTRDNLIWKAVADAPVGFCHPRSSMAGTLLEDLAAGLDFSEVSRRFAEKMHPLKYQRPQAAPSAGNIAQAEKLVEKMGIADSLRRRFARLDEIEALWLPCPQKNITKKGEVFSHLTPKKASSAIGGKDMPMVTVTWQKFASSVLPEAMEIDFFVPHGREDYVALVTAVNHKAPPILQWDSEKRRNPVSLYLWHGGSLPAQWGLSGGQFHRVSAVTLQPSMWYGNAERFAHQGQGVVFILEKARETRTDSGLALFPECLRSELREVRSTIEAFSRAGKLEGVENASACGVALIKGNNWNCRFRVRTKLATIEYRLDRWD